MSIEVKIPAVGESITSGVLSVWHKKTGDIVSEGEALFTLETDKISTEIPAGAAGKLQIQVDAGQEVKIGQVVALLDESAKPSAQDAAKTRPAPSIRAGRKRRSTEPRAPERIQRDLVSRGAPNRRRREGQGGGSCRDR